MSRTARNKPQVRKAEAWDMGPNVFLRSNLHLGNCRKSRAKGKQRVHQITRYMLKYELEKAIAEA